MLAWMTDGVGVSGRTGNAGPEIFDRGRGWKRSELDGGVTWDVESSGLVRVVCVEERKVGSLSWMQAYTRGLI